MSNKKTNTSSRDKNNNTIIFTIARMNPPTTGHMELIRKMVKEAKHSGTKNVTIILSATQDKEKNPFSCAEKKMFLEHMISRIKIEEETPKINVGIICMNDTSISSQFGTNPILRCLFYIIEKEKEKEKENQPVQSVKLVIGEDRKNEYNWIGKILNGCGDDYDHTNIKFSVETLERPSNAISATEIRNLSLEGGEENRALFMTKMENTGIPGDLLEGMFRDIPVKFSVASSKTACNPKRASNKTKPKSVKMTVKSTLKSKKRKSSSLSNNSSNKKSAKIIKIPTTTIRKIASK
jgi:nicotinamide mononucleotide adenylyltransferase